MQIVPFCKTVCYFLQIVALCSANWCAVKRVVSIKIHLPISKGCGGRSCCGGRQGFVDRQCSEHQECEESKWIGEEHKEHKEQCEECSECEGETEHT